MIGKQHRYFLANFVWFALMAALFFLLNFGYLEAYVPRSQLPGVGWQPIPGVPPTLYLFGAMFVLIVLGMFVLRLLQKWSWLRTGRRTGLSSEGGLFPTSALSGAVRGRPVRARTTKRKHSGSDAPKSQGSTTTSYTIVEAKLDESVEDGVAIERSEEPGFLGWLLGREADDDPLRVDGGSDDVDGDLLAERSGEALEAPTYFRHLSVGAVPDERMGVTGTPTRTFVGTVGAGSLGQGRTTHEDADWVTYETRGVVLDAAEMERQVEAIVAVAEAVEEARLEVRH